MEQKKVVTVHRLHSEVTLPRYATDGAAGMDVRADIQNSIWLEPGMRVLVPTGLQVIIPPGYEIQVRPRGGNALKRGLTVLNTPGTVDSDYRGEIGVIMVNHGQAPETIEPGDRVAQLVLCPVAKAIWYEINEDVGKVSATGRGDGAYSSTGTT